MRRFTLCGSAATLLSAVLATAQSPVGTVVANSTTDLHNRCSGTNNRVLAAAPDGTLWTLIYRDTGAATNNRSMSLKYSKDAGVTWQGNFPTPTSTPSSIAALAIDRRCNLLHVVWTAVDSTGFNSAYYQGFDLATLAWIGTHQQLAAGYSSNNHFSAQDVAVTPKGTVAVAVNGHRSGGYGLSAWGTGLLVKKVNDASFPPVNASNPNLLQMNASSGSGCSLQAWGEEIHCAFRDTPGGYGPAYSVFDTVSMTYTAKAVPCAPGNNTSPPAGSGNMMSFLIDKEGGKYILWPSGIVSGSTIAALRLAYAPPGKGAANGDWVDTQVFNDPATSPNGKKITGGNTSERWYTLAYAGDNNVNLIYSKPSEDFRNLYWEIWKGGSQVLGPIAPVNTTIDNKFEWVSGMRNNESENAGTFLVWGERDQTANPPLSGTVTFWRQGAGGRAVQFARTCQDNAPMSPRVSLTGVPAPGAALTVTFDQNPPNTNCFLGVGTQCRNPALDMDFMGIPGCFLAIDIPVVIGLTTNAQGVISVPWTVPGSAMPGDKIYVQNFVLVPGANPMGALISNALGVLF